MRPNAFPELEYTDANKKLVSTNTLSITRYFVGVLFLVDFLPNFLTFFEIFLKGRSIGLKGFAEYVRRFPENSLT